MQVTTYVSFLGGEAFSVFSEKTLEAGSTRTPPRLEEGLHHLLHHPQARDFRLMTVVSRVHFSPESDRAFSDGTVHGRR